MNIALEKTKAIHTILEDCEPNVKIDILATSLAGIFLEHLMADKAETAEMAKDLILMKVRMGLEEYEGKFIQRKSALDKEKNKGGSDEVK